MIEVQATMDRNSIERTTIPSIMIVCEHCGFISQHALQPLGIWPEKTAELDLRSASPEVATA
jgi:hypothetical protein